MMTKVSVIIVNYNVRHFIKQCLQSLYNSDNAEDLEIFVIDNNSHDGSAGMIKEEFPDVRLIINEENRGFAKAVNQGLEKATGKYCLILNPDTVVEEHTISSCVSFIQSDPGIGAVGVKMLDGSGSYLPESKRGFPTPLASIYKITGINNLFPKSAHFNHYYMGHLDPDEINRVEVLTGAFFMAPTGFLHKVNGMDEDYFMYGEDIELSYQIARLGYKIMYFPSVRIIHFKGESTDKNSIRYIRDFYGAMQKYARKRKTGKGVLWNVLIPLGIFFSAVSRSFRGLLNKVLRPVIDIFLIFFVARSIQNLWARYYYSDPAYYDAGTTYLLLLLLISVLIGCYYLFGQYDRRHNIKHLLYGSLIGSLVMFSVYSLLPEQYRFSRFMLVVTAVISPVLLYFSRKLYNRLLYNTFKFDGFKRKSIAIVGTEGSFEKVKAIYENKKEDSLISHIDTSDIREGHEKNIEQIVTARKINEIVFCSKDLTAGQIFALMSSLGDTTGFRIANNDNSGILGSDSKDRLGEWYTHEIAFKIDQKFHRRLKRIVDIFLSILFLVVYPAARIMGKKPHRHGSLWQVLTARYTWVGYIRNDEKLHRLPYLKPGVFEIAFRKDRPEEIHTFNNHYARNYTVWMDIIFFGKKIINNVQ